MHEYGLETELYVTAFIVEEEQYYTWMEGICGTCASAFFVLASPVE
jgi:hypothetical protein